MCITAAAALVVAAGCQGSEEEGKASGDSAPESVSNATSDAATLAGVASVGNVSTDAVSDDAACGTNDAHEAAQLAAAHLPPPFENPDQADVTWAPEYADLSSYDPCAALSWIVMPIDGGTASSPYAIALYHEGSYLGRATAEHYGFHPDVARVNGATIAVTYHYALEGDSNADPSGVAQAQFWYDTASGTVQMSGAVPPQ